MQISRKSHRYQRFLQTTIIIAIFQYFGFVHYLLLDLQIFSIEISLPLLSFGSITDVHRTLNFRFLINNKYGNRKIENDRKKMYNQSQNK